MDAFEEFERQLQGALSGLYNPAHRPAEVVWLVLDVSPLRGIEALWKALVQEVGRLEPGPDLPKTARMRRVYDLLSLRYIQGLTQEAAAERLGISPRHLRREQRDAVHVLAQRVWTRPGEGQQGRPPEPPNSTTFGDAPAAYLSQVRRELEALGTRALGSSTDVSMVVTKVVQLERALASSRGVTIHAGVVSPALMAAIHPSAFRQVLLAAVRVLVERMSSGAITIGAERDERCARVVLEGQPAAAGEVPDIDFIDEIMSWSGGSAQGEMEGDRLRFSLQLPVADPVKVLVVDDNEDMVHFFRRYVAGTRYSITSTADAQELRDLIAQTLPDIIVLDVMLPHSDGWDVLMELRALPDSREIPVVVCSVVREPELALSLGAAVYLPKPVGRQGFIQSLETALARAGADSALLPDCTPTPC